MATTRSGFTLKERIQSLTALAQVFLQGAFPALTFAGSVNKRTKPFAFADSFGKPICRAFVPLEDQAEELVHPGDISRRKANRLWWLNAHAVTRQPPVELIQLLRSEPPVQVAPVDHVSRLNLPAIYGIFILSHLLLEGIVLSPTPLFLGPCGLQQMSDAGQCLQ
jgi:hypothetical protein